MSTLSSSENTSDDSGGESADEDGDEAFDEQTVETQGSVGEKPKVSPDATPGGMEMLRDRTERSSSHSKI
jgi:hypothetical protein